jgi:hypothetical protein
MPLPSPLRIESHQLEELSVRYFRNSLPRGWTCEKSEIDYGVDLRVELFDRYQATSLELLVQMKSAANSNNQKTESVRLRAATYNYLCKKLQVAMLVKFVEIENEAYWIMLRDIPPPPQGKKTFTVRIPKSNRISNIQWDGVADYIRRINDAKLATPIRPFIEMA